MLAGGVPVDIVVTHAQGLLTEEFKVLGARGQWYNHSVKTVEEGRTLVRRFGGRFMRRLVTEWWEDVPPGGTLPQSYAARAKTGAG